MTSSRTLQHFYMVSFRCLAFNFLNFRTARFLFSWICQPFLSSDDTYIWYVRHLCTALIGTSVKSLKLNILISQWTLSNFNVSELWGWRKVCHSCPGSSFSASNNFESPSEFPTCSQNSTLLLPHRTWPKRPLKQLRKPCRWPPAKSREVSNYKKYKPPSTEDPWCVSGPWLGVKCDNYSARSWVSSYPIYPTVMITELGGSRKYRSEDVWQGD